MKSAKPIKEYAAWVRAQVLDCNPEDQVRDWSSDRGPVPALRVLP